MERWGQMLRRSSHCTNCGVSGHMFRHCSAPVTSYGLIAVRYRNDQAQQRLSQLSSMPLEHHDELEFLLIQRKDSLSFLEFIRGKYAHTNEEYIRRLLRGMTQREQERLLHYTFEELWEQIWGDASHVKSHRSNYEQSERRFELLKPHLEEWMKQEPSPWTEPEWGFPKGRRNPHESDVTCAVREFQEETGLRRHQFQLIQNTDCLTETFIGSNHVHYSHKYYLAICPVGTEVSLHPHNSVMTREIGDIRWFPLEDALAKIRSNTMEKREILLKAGKILKNFYPVII